MIDWWKAFKRQSLCYNNFIILGVKTIEKEQQEIIEEFSLFEDWMQRYEYMIELGKSLPLIENQYKTDDNIIKGCQSRV